MISDIIFIIQIIVTIAFCIIFSIFDIMKGFIPDKLNYSLLFFGILSNLILTILTNNLKFIFFSIISWSITFAITTLMWKLEIWGGGDVKLFASIASVIPFGINISFLNISPTLSFYPFSFTVMINSILVSFPVLMIFLIYLISKNGFFSKNKSLIYNFLNYKNLKFILDSNFNKHILIKDLNEGMMINNYYFNNEIICNLIDSAGDSNLEFFKSNRDGYDYYFKTITGGGITKNDMYLLKIMNAQEIISDEISIKLSYPFVPAILGGLILAIFYGDLSMLILKNIIFVI